ncbi:MAG: oligosaccharide flippase family protein [Ginsengibacter sp.]
MKVARFLNGIVRQYKDNILHKRFFTVLSIDILVKASSIILLPVYLRLMTQKEYGLYNYLLSIITTFAVVLNFGLYVPQSKYYSAAASETDKRIVIFNIFFLLTALLLVVLVPVYSFGLDFKLVNLLFKNDIFYSAYRWIILLAILVSVYALILINFFITSEKIMKFRKYNIYKLIIVNTVALASLYYFRGDQIYTRLLGTYLTEFVILIFFFSIYVRKMLPRLNKPLIVNAIKMGSPIMISAVWGMLANLSDKFFLEKYGTARDLAYYYLAFSIANILYMITAAVQNVWLPTFLKEKDIRKNIQKTKKLITSLAGLLIIAGLGLITILYFALQLKIISQKYQPALYVLPILIVAQVINSVVMIYSNYLIYLEKTYLAPVIGISTSLVGFAVSYLLIPVWNIYGAAIAYLGIQLVSFSLNYLFLRTKVYSQAY